MDNKFKKLILFAGDICVLYFSLYLTLLIRYFKVPAENDWTEHFWPFTIIFAAWILIFFISNLYSLNLAINNTKFFQLTVRNLLIGGLVAIAFFYLTPQITIAPKRNLIIYIAVFAVLFFIWRRFFNWSLKAYMPKNNIAIIGINEQAKELIKELNEKPHLGYRIVFIFDDKKDDISNLDKIIEEEKVSTLVLASDLNQSDEIRLYLFNSLRLKLNFISLPNFYETITGKIPITAINQMWFLENLSEGSKNFFNIIKRIYDIIFALLVFMATLPLWIIVGVIIKLDSKGPIFFKQTRTGKNNKRFKILKFRTMTCENNNYAPTAKNDKRITRLGAFLRKTRIDEIPQVINIIKGEMSFVGPRPERPELIKELEKNIPFYRERTLVKPGITGWDQISGEYHSPSREDSIKKIQYDLFYIKNRSIYLDLSIILKTIATVLSRGGI